MSTPHKFVLKDKDGVDHTYVCMPHPPSKGFAVVDQLLALGLGPVVEAFVASAKGGGTETDLASMMAHLDGSKVAGDILKGLDSIGGTFKIAESVLSETARDGVPLTRQGIDVAYTRNYAEATAAVKEVIEHNGFFDALSTFFGTSEG